MAPAAALVIARPAQRPMHPTNTFPLFAARVEAGFPSPADDYIDRALDLHEELVPRPRRDLLRSRTWRIHDRCRHP